MPIDEKITSLLIKPLSEMAFRKVKARGERNNYHEIERHFEKK